MTSRWHGFVVGRSKKKHKHTTKTVISLNSKNNLNQVWLCMSGPAWTPIRSQWCGQWRGPTAIERLLGFEVRYLGTNIHYLAKTNQENLVFYDPCSKNVFIPCTKELTSFMGFDHFILWYKELFWKKKPDCQILLTLPQKHFQTVVKFWWRFQKAVPFLLIISFYLLYLMGSKNLVIKEQLSFLLYI